MDVDEAPKAEDGDLSQYNLDDYDNDTPGDSESNTLKAVTISNSAQAISHFSNINNIVHHKNSDEDPYITLKVPLEPSTTLIYLIFPRKTMMKTSAKSLKSYQQTISSLSQKLKTRSHNSRSMFTKNLKRTYTFTTT